MCFCFNSLSIFILWFNIGVFYFLCSKSSNLSSAISCSNGSDNGTNVVVSIISFVFFCIFYFFPVSISEGTFLIEKLKLLIKSEIASKLKSFAPLKVAYERFLYKSVIAFLDSLIPAPKNMPRTPKNCRETRACDFVYLKIS